jgi:capsular exopolysaccharide synthesis family protein
MGRAEDEAAHADVLAQVLRILAILRRRWLVVAVTTVLGVAAAAVAITLLQPRWRASASIVLHTSGPQVLDKVKGVSEDAESRILGYREYYETQRQIMRSRTVGERALAELGLANDPVFLGISDIESEPERLAKAESIDPVERLGQLVSIEEVRNSRVVRISAEYPDPAIARDIANAVADAYLEHVRTSRRRLGSDAEKNITDEKVKAFGMVRSAESDLERFKEERAISSISLSDRQNVITQDILTLSRQAKEAEADRIRLQNKLEQAQKLHAEGNLANAGLLPDGVRHAFERLREEQIDADTKFSEVDVQFGPKHEEHRKAKRRLDMVNTKIDREAKDLISGLERSLAAAANTERDLMASLGRERRKASELAGFEREYGELEREAERAAEDYLLVARRDKEIAITNRVEADGIEILDRATVSGEPVFPQRLLLLALGLVSGLGLGSLLAISIDFRDHRIRGLIDLERALAGTGLPVLGQLPLLPPDGRLGVGNIRAQRRQRDLYSHLYPQSLMAERCRGVRTSLAFAVGRSTLRTLMVTSPNSSEGKSSTAMNLALSFCQAGKSVVIVDADMRRPRIHQVFSDPIETGGTGLSGVLQGKATIEEAAVRAPDDAPDNLHILPCGDVPGNPAELIDAPGFRRTLAELRDRFDLVVIDSPPVLPVTDPLLIARHVDGVVVVTRCDSTTRGELQRAMSLLRQGDTNLLGVILNEVDTRQERYAYNAEYYTYRATDRESEPART